MDDSMKYFDKFKDAFVNEIEWSPLDSGGASYQTHKFKKISEGKYGFFMTFGDLMFCTAWVITGCIAVFGPVSYMVYAGSFDLHFLIPIAFGIIVGPIGLVMYLISSVPRIIDLHQGIYYRSRKPPKNLNDMDKKNFAYLEEVYAIQLIIEKKIMEYDLNPGDPHDRRRSSFSSIELNLILKDTSRIHVIDHADILKLREDAESLSRILDVPVWDATLYKELC